MYNRRLPSIFKWTLIVAVLLLAVAILAACADEDVEPEVRAPSTAEIAAAAEDAAADAVAAAESTAADAVAAAQAEASEAMAAADSAKADADAAMADVAAAEETAAEAVAAAEAAMAPPPLPDSTMQLAAWQESAHGNTYALGKGPNTYCSRCHSPQNWDPASKPGPPPTCITCKFPTDEEVRITPFMDFVEEEDWIGVDCKTCHMMEGESVTSQLSWFNNRTGLEEPVNTPNELCTKCHTNSGVSWTGGTGASHAIELGGTAHTMWAGMLDDVQRPQYCTDCHDPHTQQPKGCVDCHDGVLASDDHIKGMNAMHVNVSCMACHDASGADVGRHPDEEMGGLVVPILASVGRAGPTVEAIISHSVQWQVSCDRCHFEENPFEIMELDADGEIPEEGEAGGPPG
jgi:hypothetical protein